MMKKRWMLISLVLIMILSACGSSNEMSAEKAAPAEAPAMEAKMDMAGSSYSNEVDVSYSTTTSEDTSFVYEEDTEEYAKEDQAHEGNAGGTDPTMYERKIIKTGFVYMETLTFDETLITLKKMIAKYNAYTAYSESNGGSLYERGYNTRYARYTVKVPAEFFEEMYEELHTVGHVLNSNEGKEDVTSQFVDIEARLTTLYVQEERLLSILEKTENLEDIIELEYALQNTRYEIERYTTNLRNLEDHVRYSTIEISVQEVWEETEVEKPVITFSDRINEGLKDTFREISEGFQNFIIFLVTQFPYILFAIFVIFLGVGLYKKLSKKEKERLMNARKEPGSQKDNKEE